MNLLTELASLPKAIKVNLGIGAVLFAALWCGGLYVVVKSPPSPRVVAAKPPSCEQMLGNDKCNQIRTNIDRAIKEAPTQREIIESEQRAVRAQQEALLAEAKLLMWQLKVEALGGDRAPAGTQQRLADVKRQLLSK